ncbi:MAG TPA: cupin domain-containing protein [Steroidobacteraceae bacterium]|nr:cupin domain-containing protein [Steroidobacteraceae bacterium]
MGNSPQEGGTARQLTADDPTIELDILEQTISIEGARALRHDALGLAPSPIPRSWILEGNPVARKKRLACSSDRLASTMMWDCTGGRFNWFYDEDEVIHVLEGSVIIEDAAGVRRRLQAGDTHLFPAGSRYQWTVPSYFRKIAFLYPPLSPEMRIIRGILKRLTAPFRRRPSGAAAWGA